MERPFCASRVADYPAAIGCDEVGRGALCGPVVVAAVWFDPCRFPADLLGLLDDSKRIRAPLREELAIRIRAHSLTAIAAASAATIDRLGIRHATLAAMRRAISALAATPPAYVDGRDVPPGLQIECRALVRGESQIPQIAAGSIVAKVFRDRIMRTLATRHAPYRWETNSGYGTADHLDALHRHGATRHHRRSFAPVTALLDRNAGATGMSAAVAA